MGFEFVVGKVVIAIDRRFFDGSVHAFNLTIGPRVADLGQSVLDTLGLAHTVERNFSIAFCVFAFCELNAVVCEYGVNGLCCTNQRRSAAGRIAT